MISYVQTKYIWPHLRCQVHSLMVPPTEKVLNTLIYQSILRQNWLVPPIKTALNTLIYQSILTQNWLFPNNVKNVKFVSFLSYECFYIMILWFLYSQLSYIRYLYTNISFINNKMIIIEQLEVRECAYSKNNFILKLLVFL